MSQQFSPDPNQVSPITLIRFAQIPLIFFPFSSLSEELRGIFNRLLATLVAADNGFIALSLANTARIHFFRQSDLFHMIGNREGCQMNDVHH